MPGARYFVTICARDRQVVFVERERIGMACAQVLRLIADGDVTWIAASIMPDHVHLLFELGERLELERVISKLKGLIVRRTGGIGGCWQKNFSSTGCVRMNRQRRARCIFL